jgi:hypothetical protein
LALASAIAAVTACGVPTSDVEDLGSTDEALSSGLSGSAPTNLTATVASPTAVTLAWIDHTSNEKGFVVDRATNTAFTAGVVSFKTGANVVTYSDLAVTTGTTYYYRVRAYGSSGKTTVYSAYSNTAAASPVAPLTPLYFELTVSSLSTPQVVGYYFGFANVAANLNVVPGRDDANATVLRLNGTSYFRYGTAALDLQPSGAPGDVLGVAVDPTQGRFWVKNITTNTGYYPNNYATPTGSGYDISGIAPGSVSIVFSASGRPANSGPVADSLTLNAGASAFAGAPPPGYLPWNTLGGTTWDLANAGSLQQTDARGAKVTLGFSLSNGGATASAATTGALDVRTWFQADRPAGSYVADYNSYYPSAIYYTHGPHTNNELNGPVSNNSWESAVVGVRSTTSFSH